MRFSFRKKDNAPRWVDSADLGWSPEEPLDFEPGAAPAKPGNDIGWTDDWVVEPRAAVPALKSAVVASPALEPSPAPLPPAPRAPEQPPQPANNNRTTAMLLPRLGLGLAQGLVLYLLLQARDANLWPGSDPYLFIGLFLAVLIAPLTALEALGDIEIKLLALWSGAVAFALASLGLYQQWRMPGAGLQWAALLPIALAMTIAQILLRAALRVGKPLAPYRAYCDAAWSLGARLLIWAALTGIAFALIGSGNSLFNWLRGHYPAIPLTMAPRLLILPLLGLASAAAFEIGWRVQRQAVAALITCCTFALPLLVVASIAALALYVFGSPLPLIAVVGLALCLVIAINACYRGDAARHRWRRAAEVAGAFLLIAVTGLAAASLAPRVAAFGWTAERILAAAAIVALALYGLAYAGVALISVGGGLWMKSIERANLVLALLMLATCLALSTPLADPLQHAVAAQTARANAANFDFDWLSRDGGRFGHDALLALARDPNPGVARDAALALSAPAGADAPTPTGIGANITVRTPGARLPGSLLDQDWTGTTVPPCLTKAALACDAWFLDLDGDGVSEILLVYGNDARWWAAVMKQDRAGVWRAAATLTSPPCRGSLNRMRAGSVTLADPLPGWRDVLVAGMRLSPSPTHAAELPCPR